MALVNCHECNMQVSDSARTCPNCGAPVRATQLRILKWNLTVFAIGGCLAMKKNHAKFPNLAALVVSMKRNASAFWSP